MTIEQIRKAENTTELIHNGILKTLPVEQRIELLEFRVLELEKLVTTYLRLGAIFQKKFEEFILEVENMSEQTDCPKA